MSEDRLKSSQISGYELVSSFCRSQTGHGGTAIFVESGYYISNNCKAIRYLSGCSLELHFECSAIEINKNLCVVTLYSSSSRNSDVQLFFDQLDLILNYIAARYTDLIVCGDLNIDFREDSRHKNYLFNIFEMYQLKLLYNEPTRVAKYGNHITASGLDYIVSNISSATGGRGPRPGSF